MKLGFLAVAVVITAISAPMVSAQAQTNPRPAVTSAQGTKKAGDIVVEKASLTTPETGTVEFELGTYYVPENRSVPGSRIIGIGFARFKAKQPTATPPTFHLPGGPGGSYLQSLKQETRNLARTLRLIGLYQGVSDVVFSDLRGASERGETLLFKHRLPDSPFDQPLTLDRFVLALTDLSRAAVAEYARGKVDLRGYTVKECADDVNDLRKALGYDRISLVGTSFGSQWSFAIMRRHPAIVARALLSGVEPIDCGYDMPSHVLAAVQRMWWEAEKDPRFKPYLPPGGLMAAARQVIRRLEKSPVKVKVGTSEVVLGLEEFQREAFLRGTNAPAFVLSIYHERYETWAQVAVLTRRGREATTQLVGPLIDTSLAVTPRRGYLLRTDPAIEFLGEWNFKPYIEISDIWPTEDVGDEFRNEVENKIPVVFAQGDWDTSTPVENLLTVTPYFVNGKVLIAEHGGHGVIEPIAQRLPDTMNTLLEFLKTGNHSSVPSRVKLPVPEFSVPTFPPPEQK